MEDAALLAELGAALTSRDLADSVARFARREELLALAVAFREHRKQEEAAAALKAAAPAPPVAAWGSFPASAAENLGVPGKIYEWAPEGPWDPGSAFNAFHQETPQGAKRGSAAKARGRGARRSSSTRRSAPAVEEPLSTSSSTTKLPFDFQGLQIGEDGGGKVAGEASDELDLAEMEMEADPNPTIGQSPVRASVVPPGKPPTSGDSDAFVPGPGAVPSPGLTTATVPQFNMGAPASRSSRTKTRRKSRQREVPAQDSSAADVDAPPVMSVNADEPDVASGNDSSGKATIDVVCPLSRSPNHPSFLPQPSV